MTQGDVRSRIVLSGGTRLRAHTWAGGARGAILIHGLASTSHIWDLVGPRLAHRGLTVVAYDQRGHGRSDKPSSGYGFERTSQDAAAVIRSTGLPRPIVVGHSWGANVTLELAVRRPRLLAGAILLDGGFLSLRERFDWTTAKEVLAPPAFDGMPRGTFLRHVRGELGHAVRITPQIEGVVLSLVRVDRRGRVHPRLSRANHLRILHAMWEQDTVGLLRSVRIPTLVLATRSPGAEDPGGFLRAKEEAAPMIRAIGHPVTFEWIAGIHDVPLQRPAAIAGLIARFQGTSARDRRARP